MTRSYIAQGEAALRGMENQNPPGLRLAGE